jgi:hypothetical protein
LNDFENKSNKGGWEGGQIKKWKHEFIGENVTKHHHDSTHLIFVVEPSESAGNKVEDDRHAVVVVVVVVRV